MFLDHFDFSCFTRLQLSHEFEPGTTAPPEEVFLTAEDIQLRNHSTFSNICLFCFYFIRTCKITVHLCAFIKYTQHVYLPKAKVSGFTTFHPHLCGVDLLTGATTVRCDTCHATLSLIPCRYGYLTGLSYQSPPLWIFL